MIRFTAAVPTVVLLLILASCARTPPPAPFDSRATDQNVITNLEAAWGADYKSRDLEKIVSYYADDAVFMDPSAPGEIRGKEAIRTALNMFLGDKNFAISFATTGVEVSKAGDLGFSRGTYSATMTDQKTKEPFTETGKYVCVYRKQGDGSWKSILDINTPDPQKPRQ